MVSTESTYICGVLISSLFGKSLWNFRYNEKFLWVYRKTRFSGFIQRWILLHLLSNFIAIYFKREENRNKIAKTLRDKKLAVVIFFSLMDNFFRNFIVVPDVIGKKFYYLKFAKNLTMLTHNFG